MAKFTCTKHPGLLVDGLRVRFVDGVIETDDPVVVARLDRLVADGRFGVVKVEAGDETELEASDDAEPDDPEVEGKDPEDGDGEDTGGVIERPRGNASTAEWAAYAEAQGIEIGEDESRDEIRARFE